MTQDEPVIVVTKEFPELGIKITGVQHGPCLLTYAGAELMLEEQHGKRDFAVAAFVALYLHDCGEYDHPRTVGQLIFSGRDYLADRFCGKDTMAKNMGAIHARVLTLLSP
ncbi:MAG: hypothetical protein AAGB32_00925 [Pseudomonadota bacterium]